MVLFVLLVGLNPPPNEQQAMRSTLPAILQHPVNFPGQNTSHVTGDGQANTTSLENGGGGGSMPMDLDDDPIVAHSGGDLENELREFLESGSSLHATTSSNSDDNNLVAQLLMN